MATFTPETYNLPIQSRPRNAGFWAHYGAAIPTAYTVIITDGVATASPGMVHPDNHDIVGNADVPNAVASYTGADSGSGNAGLAVFTGGHTYTVTSAEVTILEAAGYTMD